MLVTLIPLFDENLTVKAYSLFTQKKNYFLSPSMLGTGQNDGAARVAGLEMLEQMGIEALAPGTEVFVSVNNISIFADIEGQCQAPRDRLVLLMNNTVKPEEMYVKRLQELKKAGYKLAIRKLAVPEFETYKPLLMLMDYVLLDYKKVDIEKAKLYFSKVYPHIGLCAGNIPDGAAFEQLKAKKGYKLYEGEFYRVPVTKGETEVAPLKVNYIELLNMVNNTDFDLSHAADVIGRDTALVISLLQMVNRMAINSEITSIRHAAAMLGQKELKRWINTAVAGALYADKPNEITRLSLLRAKLAENLAEAFGLAPQAPELFLMGLFSVLDVILDKTMEEALELVKVAAPIKEALVSGEGQLAPVLEFIKQYELANWQEVSRQMILQNLDMNTVHVAYLDSLKWYRELSGAEI